jgi:phosphoribosylformylglycinamidine synthase
VSGNVSLYNETKAEDGSSLAILPTPAIGGVGLLEDWEKSATIGFKAAGEFIFLIGKSVGHLGSSLWRQVCAASPRAQRLNHIGTLPPRVNLDEERQAGELVRHLVGAGLLTAVHDVSDGGLAVTIAEMALAGDVGASVDVEWRSNASNLTALLFGEDQGCYVGTARSHDVALQICQLVEAAGLEFAYIGETGGSAEIQFGDNPGYSGHVATIPLADLRAAHEGFFPRLMGADAALA